MKKARTGITRVIRPKVVVLPDSALLSNPFSHEVVAAQACFRARPTARTASPRPSGVLAAGTRVLLLERLDGPMCRVADDSGQPVYTAFAGLRPLVAG